MKSVFNSERKLFTGKVSASTPLSTQRRFAFVTILKFKNFNIVTNANLLRVDNGVDAETVPVNTLSFTIKDAFH